MACDQSFESVRVYGTRRRQLVSVSRLKQRLHDAEDCRSHQQMAAFYRYAFGKANNQERHEGRNVYRMMLLQSVLKLL